MNKVLVRDMYDAGPPERHKDIVLRASHNSIELPNRMTLANNNDHSDMGVLEEVSDIGRRESSENSLKVIHGKTIHDVIDNQTGESYRSLGHNGLIV